jgi:hypothetical protein
MDPQTKPDPQIKPQSDCDPTHQGDPLIDEVRQIRREICERAGHDLDRLFEELQQVERAYVERRGVFSGVTAGALARVEASWGDLSGPSEDLLIDEIRTIRTSHRTPQD